MNRAYSVLEIKSIDEETREFAGRATNISTDLMEDIVESNGAEFALPIPFLWQHQNDKPVGHVTQAQISDNEILVRGKLVKPYDGAPASWRERLEVAWADMKTGLVRGLSIGFKPLEIEPIKGTYGNRYKRWRWLELSGVTIAANTEATITAIKSIDTQQRAAASGPRLARVVRLDSSPAGVSAPKSTPQEGTTMNVAEQIKGFEAKRQATAARREAIMEKLAEEARTPEAEEQAQLDEVKIDLEKIDKHLENLHDYESSQATRAKVVGEVKSVADASRARETQPYITVRDTLPPGMEFARFIRCVCVAKGNLMLARELAQHHFPDQHRLQVAIKAAVAAGTTTDAAWAGPLVEYQTMAEEFIEFLRPQTIIGKFGQGGIPALHPVPFNIRIPMQTSGGQGYWVGQGAPKPLTSFEFESAVFPFAKVANIAVLTQELVRFSNPSADTLTRQALADALRARLDIDFIDPAKAAVANVSPASITNGLTPVTSAGNTVDGALADLEAVMAAFAAAGLVPNAAIMSAGNALALSMMRGPLGNPVFGGMSPSGGSFGATPGTGLPVIVSEYVTQVGDSSGSPIIFLNTNEVLLADEGGVTIDASTEASLEMLDNPTNNSATATATTQVSMFQTNSVALKAERFIYWQRRREAAVQYIAAAAYTSVSGS
jgi:HK97 family phage major capsid protein